MGSGNSKSQHPSMYPEETASLASTSTHLTGTSLTPSQSNLSLSSASTNLSRGKKTKKRESHVVGGSMSLARIDNKLGLPENSNLEMPPEEQFMPSFIALLDELGLPQGKREGMMQMPADRKWTLLLQQKGREYLMQQGALDPKKHTVTTSKKPEEFLNVLRGPDRKVTDLSALEVSLRSEKISWVSEFLHADGLPTLLEILRDMADREEIMTQNDLEIQSKAMLCMKALMNNSVSLSAVLEDDRSIPALVNCLSSATVKVKTIILELLAAVCFVPPDGLHLVLMGFTDFKEFKREQFRFQTLLGSLRNHSNIDYQVSCMSLCNAIVNSSDDLEFRVHLRNEFLDLGIEDLIDELRGIDNDELNTQLNIFVDEAVADEEIMADRYGVMNINMTDPQEIFLPFAHKSLIRILIIGFYVRSSNSF